MRRTGKMLLEAADEMGCTHAAVRRKFLKRNRLCIASLNILERRGEQLRRRLRTIRPPHRECRQDTVDAMGVQRLPLYRVLPRREDITKGALERRDALPRIEQTMTLNEVLRIGGTANPCKVEPEEVPCLVTSIAVRLTAVDEEDFVCASARRLPAVLGVKDARSHEHEQARVQMRALDAIAFSAVEMPELRRIGDLGSHLLSVSQFIMGDISAVDAMKTTIFPERPKAKGSSEMAKVENEDIISFMMEYANGTKGMISSSRVATGRKNYLAYEIQGTKGSVKYDLERMGEVQVYFQDDAERDRGFRQVFLNPLHKGYSAVQPAGGISIAYNDMKILEIHELFSAITQDTNVLLCLDTGHHVYGEGEPIAFFKKHAPKTLFVSRWQRVIF